MSKSRDIQTKIRLFINSHGLLHEGARILVALSGGADSVMLLRILIGEGYDVEAAHCNFRLRGDESMRDETFVHDLCRRLQVPLHSTSFDTQAYARSHGISIEMAARELRYGYFEQLRRECGFDAIAVAHHRDDNIETVLLNMVRGTGIKGLTGIQPRNGHVVRPLLCISRNDIVDYLDETGQDYVTDSTNLESVYSRNKIRLDVLPLLRSINPGADDNIATTIENMQEAYKAYRQAMDESMLSCTGGQALESGGHGHAVHADDTSYMNDDTLYINKEELMLCPSPLSVLHELLSSRGFNRAQMSDLLQSASVGASFFSKSHRALVDRTDIVVTARRPDAIHSPAPLSQCRSIRSKTVGRHELAIDPDRRFAYVDTRKIHGPLTVRTVQTGDSFHPFGMKGRKLVSDFLTDLKLTRIEKERQTVVCDDDGIVWVVGRRSSELHKVDDETDEVLVLEACPQ